MPGIRLKQCPGMEVPLEEMPAVLVQGGQALIEHGARQYESVQLVEREFLS